MTRTTAAFLAFVLLSVSAGCVKLALRTSPSLIPNLTEAIFEECDADLARQSLPADLKLMEGLLKNDPENRQLLTALCMGFTGYAMLFVEDESPERASRLYARARSYGLRSLGRKADLIGTEGSKKKSIRQDLKAMGHNDVQSLFWVTISWNAWINLNLDRPSALVQIPVARACLERLLELAPDYLYGTPYIIMGTVLSAMPRQLGGDSARARSYFEKAVQLSGGRFFLSRYYFARYYAVREQDKELFLKLIQDLGSEPSDPLKDVCLINTVIKQKAVRLKEMCEELFF